MQYWKAVVGGFTLFSIYTIFWFWFFDTPKPHKNIVNIPRKQFSFKPSENKNSVLGVKSDPELILPPIYRINIDPRRQFFNLSCEFAAAASVIFHFTNNPDFSALNELIAEKTLINKMWISRNPNVGIRMGQGSVTSLDVLYLNLNKWFGGSDYYGIHASPFIGLFADYHLIAKPIYINDSIIASIQRAISNNHLVMTWIKIGYAKPIDDYLSYGKVKVVRGEHSVVINGYNESGVVIMDPAIGLERHIEYTSLLDASSPFPMPFLEVYQDIGNKVSSDNLTVGYDSLTGIDRSIPRIHIQNGSKETGAANQARDILRDFGYNIVGISNADNFDYLDVEIKVKKDFSDFLYILNRDMELAGYTVAKSSSDLSDGNKEDAVVIVGR